MKKLLTLFLILLFVFQIKLNFCFAEEFSPANAGFSLIDLEDHELNENTDSLKAVILSAFVPGSGQIYKGDLIKGILIFVSFFSLLALEVFVVNPMWQKLQIEKKTAAGSLEFVSLADKIGIVSLWLFSLGDSYQRDLPYEKKKEKNIENQNNSFSSGFKYDLFSLSF